MKNMRLAIILAACCALLSPGLAAAQTWTQIKNASVDTDAMNTALTATNFPLSGKDNIDVYATWGDDTSPRVASCGPVVGTSCPTFTRWVNISPTTIQGQNFGTESAVGWGTTTSSAHREVFVTVQDKSLGRDIVVYSTRDGNHSWSSWTSLDAPPGNGTCLGGGGQMSGPQAISQAKNMISVFVVGIDCNLYINYNPAPNGGWSGWLNLTGGGLSPLANSIQSVNSQGSSIAVVYSNFRTTNPTTTPLNQIHVIVLNNNPNQITPPNTVYDVNYFADASINYDPTPGINWAFTATNTTVDPNNGSSWNAIGAAATPPGTIAVFADQGNVSSVTGVPTSLMGQQLIEEDGSIASTTGTEVANGLTEEPETFVAAPVPVTLGKQGADCDTTRSCKDAVFFINGAGNIQYSIWGVDKPADAWDTTVGTFGIKTVGTASSVFNSNPTAVVSQNGTTVYVFAARANPSLCGGDCGNVYYAHFTP